MTDSRGSWCCRERFGPPAVFQKSLPAGSPNVVRAMLGDALMGIASSEPAKTFGGFRSGQKVETAEIEFRARELPYGIFLSVDAQQVASLPRVLFQFHLPGA